MLLNGRRYCGSLVLYVNEDTHCVPPLDSFSFTVRIFRFRKIMDSVRGIVVRSTGKDSDAIYYAAHAALSFAMDDEERDEHNSRSRDIADSVEYDCRGELWIDTRNYSRGSKR